MSDDTLIPIVDADDYLIGHKPRSQIARGDIYRITVLWVTNSQGDVLLAQRSFKKKKDPGLWSGAVAGTVEQGETYEQNIIREAHEEIGADLAQVHLFKKYYYAGEQSFICAIFKTVLDQPIHYFTRQVEEIEQLAWVPYGTLVRELNAQPEKYVPSLPAFLDHLEKD